MNPVASAIVLVAAILAVVGIHVITAELRWRRMVERFQADNQRQGQRQVEQGESPHHFTRR